MAFLFAAIAIAWIAWMIRVPFSRAARESVRRRPWLHFFWFLSLPVAGYLSLCAWPPVWFERQAQRSVALARVRSAGGWEALRKDCVALTFRHEEEGLRWSKAQDTGLKLPGTIAALEPSDIVYQPIDMPGTNVHIVRLKLFGSTVPVGHAVPYYGLEVVFGPDAAGYRPQRQTGADGKSYTERRKLVENIYEIH